MLGSKIIKNQTKNKDSTHTAYTNNLNKNRLTKNCYRKKTAERKHSQIIHENKNKQSAIGYHNTI